MFVLLSASPAFGQYVDARLQPADDDAVLYRDAERLSHLNDHPRYLDVGRDGRGFTPG
jgi:hypothetical protein